MSRATKIVIAVVAVLLVTSAVGGVAVLLLYGHDDGTSATSDQDKRVVRAWCGNVRAGLAPGEAYSSFAEVIAAAVHGDLREPDRKPNSTAPDDIDAWQELHREYLTSSYLQALRGFPKEVSWEKSVFDSTLAEAHEGRRITYPADARRAAAHLDRYVERSC
jgi:hypothetical protein